MMNQRVTRKHRNKIASVMSDGPQYNERDIINRFFHGKIQGLLVEVGAADGIDNSHTRHLIEEYDWIGLLIEPLPEYYEALKGLYADRPNVQLVNKAIFNEEGAHDFYVHGQISRLSVLDNVPKITVDCVRLDNLLDGLDAKHIDFLSVDAEGADMVVLETFDWKRWRPSLICVEYSMGLEVLQAYMDTIGYKLMEKNIGNAFFIEYPDGTLQ